LQTCGRFPEAAMFIDKQEALNRLKELVGRFHSHANEYLRSGSDYNETQLRRDFIDPFFELLGWDITNEKGLAQHLREVVVEYSFDDESFTKRPDYAFRVAGKRKFFVEAKKPSISIRTDGKPAFQAKRYGWSASLPVCILTNFDQLIIYDCRNVPKSTDNANVARRKIYSHSEYVQKFDEIYAYLSRESAFSGKFDEVFRGDIEHPGAEPFDDFFLKQIENWRVQLAEDLISNNHELNVVELNFLVQRLLNRIIFLRICEDRNLEKYGTLKDLGTENTYQILKKLFDKADKKYNSDLFDFIEDELSLKVSVGSQVLILIFKELYYPESPYAFSVVDAKILSEIYELFLSKSVEVKSGAKVVAIEKPEVKQSSGIVKTPGFIVESILKKTLVPLCKGKTPEELSKLRLVDIACGSGAFLVAAYDYLMNYCLDWYLRDGIQKHQTKLYEGPNNEWRLTLDEKQRILLNNIYGVDVDVQVVEVSRFSLLLKILENESNETIEGHFGKFKKQALPNLNQNIVCGNSLVDKSYYSFDKQALKQEQKLERINIFDWNDAFREIFEAGGFDLIVGNPPYIRIQNMVKYAADEVKFYQSEKSPYRCAQGSNFDKYMLFVERALNLLKPSGLIGYIVPHKFFKIKAGKALRSLISSGKHLKEIVDFGVLQVFGGDTTTYTCLLILSKSPTQEFKVERVRDLSTWCDEKPGAIISLATHSITSEPWIFLPENVLQLFARLREGKQTKLSEIAEIFVGVQTSKDSVYVIHPLSETSKTVIFQDLSGKSWRIEKSILRPCLLDAPLEAFGRPKPNTYIIFPYKVSGRTAKLYTEVEMRSQFPVCWKYLKFYKTALIPPKRNVQNFSKKTWYRYGRSQSLSKFEGEKIIFPILSTEPRYAYDDNNIVITGGGNGPYYAIRLKNKVTVSLFYLQAILCSPVFEAMVRSGSSFFRGGYYSHGKQFIKDIPIRNIDLKNSSDAKLHNQVVNLVQQLIVLNDKTTSVATPHKKLLLKRKIHSLRQELDLLVCQLYSIQPVEVELCKRI